MRRSRLAAAAVLGLLASTALVTSFPHAGDSFTFSFGHGEGQQRLWNLFFVML